ncbi:MAG: ABC transporter permease [Nitrososphaerales archaeon]
MLGYIVRRLLLLIPTLFGVTLIVFAIMKATPGDPILVMLGAGYAEPPTPETLALQRAKLGLDQPIYIQYLSFLWRLIQGDLGKSVYSGRPVIAELADALPNTILLTVTSMCIAIPIGVIAGIIASTKQYTIFDNLSMIGSLAAASLPSFWLGFIIMLIFGYYLNFFPLSGSGTPAHLVLPSITLGAAGAGLLARLTRSSMLEVIRKDFIKAIKAKGLDGKSVLLKHALKNAAIPIVTVIGNSFGNLLAGAFLVEVVFAWPGMGRLAVQAVAQRNYPVVYGTVLTVALLFVLINLIVDILYAYLDPRIQFERKQEIS